jgi:hypothetical protein
MGGGGFNIVREAKMFSALLNKIEGAAGIIEESHNTPDIVAKGCSQHC